MIHKTAIINPKAKISSNVAIGAYSVVGPDVEIDENTIIHSHVVVSGNTKIGKNNKIYPFASIGNEPQDLKYNGEDTKLIIGNKNTIREYVTINPGTVGGGSETIIGNNCLLMISSHVAHDCLVEDNAVIANNVAIAGHAQIGKNVHLSGGVGIGGVLEPLQAAPVIIEDNAFIGSRCIVVEGVRVENEAVLGAGVVLTMSTKVIDVTGEEPKEFKGIVPARSVVIPGSYAKEFPSGTFNVPCALIIGKRKESTNKKTSLNDALRTHNVAV